MDLIDKFFHSLDETSFYKVYLESDSNLVIESGPDNEGWVKWKLIKNGFIDYSLIEKRIKFQYPIFFKKWHSRYFFYNLDCSIIRLPGSPFGNPLNELMKMIDLDSNSMIPELLSNNLIPFAQEGNDSGFLVFDNKSNIGSAIPIRLFFYEYHKGNDKIGPILFSSFEKLIECLTFFNLCDSPNSYKKVFQKFFEIDPNGAGSSSGREYWNIIADIYE